MVVHIYTQIHMYVNANCNIASSYVYPFRYVDM